MPAYRNPASDMYNASLLGLYYDVSRPPEEQQDVIQAIDAAMAGQFSSDEVLPTGLTLEETWDASAGDFGSYGVSPGRNGNPVAYYNSGSAEWMGLPGGRGNSMSQYGYVPYDAPASEPEPEPVAPPPPNNSPPPPPAAPPPQPPAQPPAQQAPAQARVPEPPVNIATVTQPTPHTGPTPSGAGNTNPAATQVPPQTDSNLAQTAQTGLQNSPPAFDPSQLAQVLQSWMQQYGTQPAAPSEMTGEAIDPATAGTIDRGGGGLAGLMSDSPYANGSMPSEAVSAGFAPLGGGIGSQRRPQTIKSGLAGLMGIG